MLRVPNFLLSQERLKFRRPDCRRKGTTHASQMTGSTFSTPEQADTSSWPKRCIMLSKKAGYLFEIKRAVQTHPLGRNASVTNRFVQLVLATFFLIIVLHLRGFSIRKHKPCLANDELICNGWKNKSELLLNPLFWSDGCVQPVLLKALLSKDKI